jgi:hypothetical protein
MMERLQLLQRLERVMEETEFGWSLLMVGEDQSRKLADLTNDLKRPYSTTGDGKQIQSGYSYWGIEPAIAWQHACNDPYYPVGKDGIDSFEQRWNDLQPALAGVKYHYVSLGPGTGDKDRTVLRTMQPAYPRDAVRPGGHERGDVADVPSADPQSALHEDVPTAAAAGAARLLRR